MGVPYEIVTSGESGATATVSRLPEMARGSTIVGASETL
jgi:hypothetical protein